jgi:hypothetical protein
LLDLPEKSGKIVTTDLREHPVSSMAKPLIAAISFCFADITDKHHVESIFLPVQRTRGSSSRLG